MEGEEATRGVPSGILLLDGTRKEVSCGYSTGKSGSILDDGIGVHNLKYYYILHHIYRE